ncbi:DNA oxidative demethylase AlkB [Pseudomonas sp. DTU_2021_1001937_2_SI_NGA_ILE_001]|uniref:DNA oxidative demethylase AlkB n=1 Tax=Pseudomonas sp. DTU_2021_1001937_2_SI_NGA_ILE_001 TaxID=3077589 RepID=UPI0028FC1517|nr:DNA oxidative demethylase AlkB [Pseudomonas sp. DTU_2021_1001937_2_SI_NGA_ILE_001]WNW10312.1 DNA oxidative demethylase AlkB [Pseudomonas sp. DTU_2021_1001937_2_SI_NGA_ILE_001]
MTFDLFADDTPQGRETLGPSAVLLRGHALPQAESWLALLEQIEARSPFRHMYTPGGYRMSAAMTCCGELGWITDRRGYRYSATDPLTGQPWPPMPDAWRALAGEAAQQAGFQGFEPDACLINRYVPGAKMSLHQDKDERDHSWPVVSVSLGLPAVFQFGGLQRTDKTQRVPLFHGDVLVWGGADRLRFHGILPLAEGEHPRFGAQRINLTFRKAG